MLAQTTLTCIVTTSIIYSLMRFVELGSLWVEGLLSQTSISSQKMGEELLLSLERLGPREVVEERLNVLLVADGDTVHWKEEEEEGEGD